MVLWYEDRIDNPASVPGVNIFSEQHIMLDLTFDEINRTSTNFLNILTTNQYHVREAKKEQVLCFGVLDGIDNNMSKI